MIFIGCYYLVSKKWKFSLKKDKGLKKFCFKEQNSKESAKFLRPHQHQLQLQPQKKLKKQNLLSLIVYLDSYFRTND